MVFDNCSCLTIKFCLVRWCALLLTASAALEKIEHSLKEQYRNALRTDAAGRSAEARAMYEQTLTEWPLPKIDHCRCAVSFHPLLQLKYLCLKNLAHSYNQSGLKQLALTHWSSAVRLDESGPAAGDTYVWYHFGCAALDAGKLPLARYALEKALSTASDNFLVVDKLLDVLYLISDWPALSQLITRALQVCPRL